MDNNYTLYSNRTFESHLKSVFMRMAVAMGITSIVSYAVFLNIVRGGFLAGIILNPIFMIVLIVAELGVTIAWRANLFNTTTNICQMLFYLYAFLNGLTFGLLPLAYDLGTITLAFVYTMVFFICCSIIGYTTKLDLTRIGTYLFAALTTLFIASILSIFIPALRNSLILSFGGVILFMIYTAYDIQKIKASYYAIDPTDEKLLDNFAVYGAFELYLDFINLFLKLLQILNRRRRD